MSLLRYTGALASLPPSDLSALLARPAPAGDPHRTAAVAALIDEVRSGGDEALRQQADRFDGGAPAALEVPRDVRRAALDGLDGSLRSAMERALRNLTAAHEAQAPAAVATEVEPGVRVERRPEPLSRVGVYAPGGGATYPSSVLMGAVPARVAGVGEIILCTPARVGSVSPQVLAAAELAGVDRVFAAGGAGAIAALAYGTESIPAVDRIVGPGNAWVAEAKRQVQSRVDIDGPAGPSELLIVAGEGADAGAVAREMLAQAEHALDSQALALIVGDSAASRVVGELETAVARCDRREVVRASLARGGAILALRELDEAWPLVERYAPEHLLLATADPRRDLARVRCAGAVFLGAHSSVVFGDYLAGANHVLPTAGAARSRSGLSVLDFVRWTSVVEVTRAGAASLAGDAARFARAEGLSAHATAAAAWSAR